MNPIPEGAQASSTGREEGCLNPSDEPMTTEDPVMGTLTERLASLELNPGFGKVAQLVMLIPQGRVSTPLVKEVQQK
jgi:hypothetical protein